MSELEITGLEKSYASQSVSRKLDLRVEEGTFVSILGPSGSGKTTLLRVIAGFERADGGRVRLRGEVVDDESNFVDLGTSPNWLRPPGGQPLPSSLRRAQRRLRTLARPASRSARPRTS